MFRKYGFSTPAIHIFDMYQESERLLTFYLFCSLKSEFLKVSLVNTKLFKKPYKYSLPPCSTNGIQYPNCLLRAVDLETDSFSLQYCPPNTIYWFTKLFRIIAAFYYLHQCSNKCFTAPPCLSFNNQKVTIGVANAFYVLFRAWHIELDSVNKKEIGFSQYCKCLKRNSFNNWNEQIIARPKHFCSDQV